MDSVSFSTKILIIDTSHSKEFVCLIMVSFIKHRLHVKEEEMEQVIFSATSKMGDQLMAVISLCSKKMSAHNM